jgi:hypothetical protein
VSHLNSTPYTPTRIPSYTVTHTLTIHTYITAFTSLLSHHCSHTTALTHCSHTIHTYITALTSLLSHHCFTQLLLHTALTHCSHTLLSHHCFTPLLSHHCSCTLLTHCSYTLRLHTALIGPPPLPWLPTTRLQMAWAKESIKPALPTSGL